MLALNVVQFCDKYRTRTGHSQVAALVTWPEHLKASGCSLELKIKHFQEARESVYGVLELPGDLFYIVHVLDQNVWMWGGSGMCVSGKLLLLAPKSARGCVHVKMCVVDIRRHALVNFLT